MSKLKIVPKELLTKSELLTFIKIHDRNVFFNIILEFYVLINSLWIRITLRKSYIWMSQRATWKMFIMISNNIMGIQSVTLKVKEINILESILTL